VLKKIILFLLISINIFPQVSGKIVGKITDESGNELPGVNVIIEGRNIGASTDIEGKYIILNISPGKYSVVASYIGYQKVKETGIIVKPGLTTEVDFILKEQSVDLGEEIIVSPREKLVQKDATSKITTLSSDELEKLPIENLQEVLSTQSNISVLTNTPNAKAGYNERGIDDIRLRGGRSNEVSLMIDGVKVSNPIFGGFGTQISKNAINQVAIESGGYSAKYGNALSGVINLTTKEGNEKTSGSVRYYSSYPMDLDFLSNERSKALRLQNVQTTLSGRLPLLKNVSFFLSSEVSTSSGTTLLFDDIVWDDYRTIQIDTDGDGDVEPFVLPTSQEIIDGYLKYGNLDSIQTGLASNWDNVIGPDGRKINPIDMYSGWVGLGWNNSYNLFGKLNFNLFRDLKVMLSFLMDKRYRQYNSFNAYYDYNMQGQNVQIISSNKQTLTLNHTLSSNTFYSFSLSRFYSKTNIRILKDYNKKYASKWDIFNPPSDNIKIPDEYIPYASSDAVYDPFESSFYLVADNRWYTGDFSTNHESRFDFTSQVTPLFMVETGFQANLIDIDHLSYQNISSVDPYPTIYQYSPLEGGVYFQNKAEFESIIFNIGGRFDYLNTGGYTWEDPFDVLGEQDFSSDTVNFNSLVKVDAKFSFSPRIGIAYPLTESSVLSFNFGHFFQIPNYRDMYRATTENREISIMQGNLLGNPNLLPEKSIQYEIALQYEIVEDYVIKLNLWNKETINQVGSVVVPAYSDPGSNNPFSYSIFINNNLGSAKGFEVNLTKRFSNNYSFLINYSFSQAKVLQPTSWDGYWSGDTQDNIPKKETTAPWDQTHVIRASFQYSFAENDGFELFSLHPLSNFDFSVNYYGETGMPYTPTIQSGIIVEPYSANWTFAHKFDVRFSKLWEMMGMKFVTLLQIKNLFDNKNVLSGYTLTGSPTNPGTSSYFTRSSSYWDSRNNNNFDLPRTIYLGIEVQFGGAGY